MSVIWNGNRGAKGGLLCLELQRGQVGYNKRNIKNIGKGKG